MAAPTMIRENTFDGKVLVLGNDNRSFLSVIRSLGRKNICIHVGECDGHIYALKSKYISQFHQFPPYAISPDQWKNYFINLIRKEAYDLIIPCNDQVIIPLQENKNEIDGIGHVYLLDDDVFSLVNDKFKVSELAKRLDIPLPEEIKISRSTTVEDILSVIPLPVVLKPRASFTADNLRQKHFVKKVYTEDELQSHLDRVSGEEFWVVQKNFIGTGAGVELLAHEGQILLAFQHIRIHEPLHGGGSSYRKSVQLHPELLDASEKLMKSLNYTGVAMVEFKIDLDTNHWMFIELNARFWGSLPLAVAAGADFPYYLYRMLTKGEKDFPRDYKNGIYCRNLSRDIDWFRANLKADRSDPTLSTVPLWKLAGEVFNIITLKERNDTFVIDDIGPGIAELVDLLKIVFGKIYHKVGFCLISALPFRIMQKHVSLRALKRARSILFLCKGNICRSPFAQYYFKTICPSDLNVQSCGYYPKKGRTCPQEAIIAAKKMGIDLSAHRSIIINSDIIERSDIIFVFDEDNLEYISTHYPSAKVKTYRISSLNLNVSLVIKDPFGQKVEFFDDTYETIKGALGTKEILDVFGCRKNYTDEPKMLVNRDK